MTFTEIYNRIDTALEAGHDFDIIDADVDYQLLDHDLDVDINKLIQENLEYGQDS